MGSQQLSNPEAALQHPAIPVVASGGADDLTPLICDRSAAWPYFSFTASLML
jgi:hypothetical protein